MKKITLTYKDLEGNFAEETVWGQELTESNYQIDNIPFFAPNIALGDIVKVEVDNGVLHFSELFEESGNTTIRIIFFCKSQSEKTMMELESLGCSWEGMKDQPYYAVNVPKHINYLSIKDFLEAKAKNGTLDYEESCLSETHRNS
jgi:hypothetical protein